MSRRSPHKPRAADPVSLKWVDGSAPALLPAGTSFGLPWAQGEVDKTTPFAARSNSGDGIPVQTWPLAYWPDGSLKWTGHALSASDSAPGELFEITTDTPTEPSSPVSVSDGSDSVTVTAGSFTAIFNKSGSTLVSSLAIDGQAKAQDGRLVLHLQDGPDEEELTGARPSVTDLYGNIESVSVEQSGPVRAVIKVSGKYKGDSHADIFPFFVRFYVTSGSTSLRLVHFFIYDGDQNKDFIKGLGLTFNTPLSDELYNRHIRFTSSEGGVYGEAVRMLSGLRRDATAAVLDPQFNGKAAPDPSTWPTTISSAVNDIAVWSDFSLDQLSSTRYDIKKRSNAGEKAGWLKGGGHGTKAGGVGYVGGANGGGVVFGLKDFWEGAPRSLDIKGTAGDTASVTIWAYSPKAPAIDMRHYDTVAHGLDLAYEDVGDPDPDPTGIGRSYDVTIQVVSSTPARDTLAQWSSVNTTVPQLVAEPSFYAAHELFGGAWDVPDSSASGGAALEQRKSDLLDFYVAEISQRDFYGFWNYGDVMHTYDSTRHAWRYDVGGYAWDNGELGTDLWLWISFLRTGRADVWRVAHAMTRHLSEVDTHHTGPYAGIGSRHNVSHWGDGAKEARVAGSWLRRPFYYLTADELMGDIMDYTLSADQTLMIWEPLRKVLPPPDPAGGGGRLRIGPDWVTLAGNWFTKWERTNDSQWLDRIKIGMRDIASFKYGMFTGSNNAVGWNADSAHLVDLGGEGTGSYHLTMIFGGGEFLMEAMRVITDEPEFDAVWLDFCKYYNATKEEITAKYGKYIANGGFQQLYAKLQAYAGVRLGDDAIKQAAWNWINSNTTGNWSKTDVVRVEGSNVLNPINEIPNLATNDAGSRSLSEYGVLAFAPEFAPNTLVKVKSDADWDRSTIAPTIYEEKEDAAQHTSLAVERHGVKMRLRDWFCLL